ncbi:MAG: acetylxylan esterase [Rhodoglobus sp.]
MPLTDLPLEQLKAFTPEVTEPEDFDEFWASTLAESRDAGGDVRLDPVESALSELIVEDLTFPGFAGEPVRAWVIRPRHLEGPLPTVVEFVGYGGGRGLPHEHLGWAASGFVNVVMDTRGQGSAWGSGGETPDPHGAGSAFPGSMTRGILDPADYYYRRVFTDAVRLVDAVRELSFVDTSRVAVTGGSQGGGITLAVAGLRDDLWGVMPDVPFLCHFRRAIEVTPMPPFTEITRYLAVHRNQTDAVLATLSYFDGVNFARRATATALFSVALMDEVVMPSTVFAAYNSYAGQREIEVYPHNNHEGGQGHQWLRQVRWLKTMPADH